MVKIGLTGGIGSGKSYVAGLLKEFGLPVYDSDSHAKSLMVNDMRIASELRRLAGEDVIVDNSLNRRKLADYIFSDPEHVSRVNALVHPVVFDDFNRWASDLAGSDICVFESAILFETGFDRAMDVTVCVDAPLETRIKRCIERDGVNRERIEERIASQMGQEEKCSLADFVILNDGIRNLHVQISELLEYCKNKS